MKRRRISIIGIILVLLGIATLIMALNRANTFETLINEARADVVAADYEHVNSAYEGKLVGVSGKLTAEGILSDSLIGIGRRTVMLRRVVETYQWFKSCDDACEYVKTWHEGLIDSKDFGSNHVNPSEQKYESQDFIATDQKFGAYILPKTLIQKLSYDTTLGPDEIAELYHGDLKIFNEYLTNSADPSNPAIGDYRIGYQYVKDKTITVIAQQKGDSFAEFRSSSKETFFEVDEGSETAEEFINRFAQNNKGINWVLAGIGIILVIFGAALIYNSLKGRK